MSFATNGLQIGECLYWPGFPELVRVTPTRLEIQVQSGFVAVSGYGLQFLYLDLFHGTTQSVAIPGRGASWVAKSNSHQCALLPSTGYWPAGDWCPVRDDLILMESESSKDYLAREALTFFGRLGRRNGDYFILGFVSHWYRIEAMKGEGDDLATEVLSGRLRVGKLRGFTTLPPDSFLEPDLTNRCRVAQIERIEPDATLLSSMELLESYRMAEPIKYAEYPIGEPSHPTGDVDID